ncbi:MAG: 4-alpha-glucanotransferase, partial [Chlamydiales bacterium]|nr:4-alpha-glucanotransferase [Chlamydiales bacterium]
MNTPLLSGLSYHGINLSLASLKTKDNLGIGEFFDLIPLIDWCGEIGFQVIQLLPLNDSSFDPSPYNAMSSCAINPIYLSLRKLHFLSDDIHHPFGQFQPFIDSKKIAYQQILTEKTNFLYRYYERFFSRYQQQVNYQEFIEKNDWLYLYSVFKVLKDTFHYQPWEDWPKEIQQPTPSHITKLYHEHKKMCDFYIFLQFLSFGQLKEVHHYASKKRIFLKGDLPILLSPESVDVWYKPH